MASDEIRIDVRLQSLKDMLVRSEIRAETAISLHDDVTVRQENRLIRQLKAEIKEIEGE